MAIIKYIIDKPDLTELLKGEVLATPKGNLRGFCVEIAGNLTNGDIIKAMFPDAQIDYHEKSDLRYVTVFIKDCDTCQDYSYDWWNAPYKAESEPWESKKQKVNCKSTKCENCINHNYCDFESQES